jgi:hypothetical protein
MHPLYRQAAAITREMKLLDIPLGFVINFNVLELTDGVARLILPNANSPD